MRNSLFHGKFKKEDQKPQTLNRKPNPSPAWAMTASLDELKQAGTCPRVPRKPSFLRNPHVKPNWPHRASSSKAGFLLVVSRE